MPPTPDDEAAFWAAIEQAPSDDLPKLVFADWLDERGDPRAGCLRWLVAHRKGPALDRHEPPHTWDWWSNMPADPSYYEPAPESYTLPGNLFTRLRPVGGGFWKGEPSYAAAVMNLCRAWAECAREGVDPLAGDKQIIEEE